MQDNQLVGRQQGRANWSAGFMPAVYQGSPALRKGAEPVPNPQERPRRSRLPSSGRSSGSRLSSTGSNRGCAGQHPEQRELLAPASPVPELAFRMQARAPEAVDLSQGTARGKPRCAGSATRRQSRSAEAVSAVAAAYGRAEGVRFDAVFTAARAAEWDAHSGIEGEPFETAASRDRPARWPALRSRTSRPAGLLDETLAVVWGGEVRPDADVGAERERPRLLTRPAFAMWMAGGGDGGARRSGSTDELGLPAVEIKLHVRDLHTSILHLLGLRQPGPSPIVYKGGPDGPRSTKGSSSSGSSRVKVVAG